MAVQPARQRNKSLTPNQHSIEITVKVRLLCGSVDLGIILEPDPVGQNIQAGESIASDYKGC